MKILKTRLVTILSAVFILLPMFFIFAKEYTIDNPLGDSTSTLSALIISLVTLAAKLGAVVCVFFIIYAGFLFVKAQGDPKELETAKSVLLWSVVGTAVLLGASVMGNVICETVKSVLGSSNSSSFTCPKK